MGCGGWRQNGPRRHNLRFPRTFIYWTVQRATVFARQQRRKTTVLRYARITRFFYRLQIDSVPRGHSKPFFPFGRIPRLFAVCPHLFFYLPRNTAYTREHTVARCMTINQCRPYERASGAPGTGPRGLRETPQADQLRRQKKSDEQKKVGHPRYPSGPVHYCF